MVACSGATTTSEAPGVSFPVHLAEGHGDGDATLRPVTAKPESAGEAKGRPGKREPPVEPTSASEQQRAEHGSLPESNAARACLAMGARPPLRSRRAQCDVRDIARARRPPGNGPSHGSLRGGAVDWARTRRSRALRFPSGDERASAWRPTLAVRTGPARLRRHVDANRLDSEQPTGDSGIAGRSRHRTRDPPALAPTSASGPGAGLGLRNGIEAPVGRGGCRHSVLRYPFRCRTNPSGRFARSSRVALTNEFMRR